MPFMPVFVRHRLQALICLVTLAALSACNHDSGAATDSTASESSATGSTASDSGSGTTGSSTTSSGATSSSTTSSGATSSGATSSGATSSGATSSSPTSSGATSISTSTAGSTALTIISRGVPSYASSGTASYGNDASYDDVWRSSGTPATLAYDLSGASPKPSSILVVWYNDYTYGYDHALLGAVGYNNAGSYTIEVNAAAGGGAVPTSGWVTAATVSGNTLHSKEHVVAFTGYNWVRMNATVSDGSPENTDIAVKMDVYDASNGITDGWYFGGDSITANCMGHGTEGGSTYDSFNAEVAALSGHTPPQENAGMPGWTTTNYGQYLAGWLANFPGRYVTINLGTNDAAGAMAPATFYAQLAAMVQTVLNAGKVPVVPTIPWSRDATHAANIPGLNTQIQTLYAKYSGVTPGPDLYTFFNDNQSYISSDNVHPTAAGCAALRSQWAQFAARTFY